jgi:hypothetical protein
MVYFERAMAREIPMTIPAYITTADIAAHMMRISSAPIHLTNRNLVKILNPMLTIVMQRNAVETAMSCGALSSVDDMLSWIEQNTSHL